jgi:hypothetical protein
VCLFISGPKHSSKAAHAPPIASSSQPAIPNGTQANGSVGQTVPNSAETNSAAFNSAELTVKSAGSVVAVSPGDGLMTLTQPVLNDVAALTAVSSSTSPPSLCKTGAGNSASSCVDVRELLKCVELPEKIGPELVEEVRKNTGLSFDKSKMAVETVLGYVGFKVPALEGIVDRMLHSLQFGVSSKFCSINYR